MSKAFGEAFKGMMDWTHKMAMELRDLFGWFGKIGKAFEAFKSGGSLKERLQKIKQVFEGKEDAGKETYGPPAPDKQHAENTPDPAELMAIAKTSIDVASRNPLASQTTSSIISRQNSLTNSVTIGELNVNTQATDSDGIASTIHDSLAKHTNKAITNFDNGLAA